MYTGRSLFNFINFGVVPFWEHRMRLKRAGIVLDDSERASWNFTPFVGVGPLRFGMGYDEVLESLGEAKSNVTSRGSEVDAWAAVHYGISATYGLAATTYYGDGGGLCCVAIDARHGPQVSLRELRLVGRKPSVIADELIDHILSVNEVVSSSLEGDPGSDGLGLVLRAQRAGDVLLSRPVFVAREWSRSVADSSLGRVPQAEWAVR